MIIPYRVSVRMKKPNRMYNTQYMFNELNSTDHDKIHITSFDM